MFRFIIFLITVLVLAACQPGETTLPPAPPVDVPLAGGTSLPATVTDAPPAAVPAPQTDETASPTAAPALSSVSGTVIGLIPSRAEPGDGFGQSVAADGETIVVGAPQAEGRRGAVYVFVREGGLWREAVRLTASDGMANDFFGQSVAISGETIVVGASGHPALGFATGAAYVFQNQQGNWVETQKLTSSPAQDVRFGWSVDADGETIIVGAPYGYNQGEIINVGSASIFRNNGQGWEIQTRLASKSGGARSSDQFGWSVAVHGSSVAVGAHLNNIVYLYRLSNGQWREETALRGVGSQFGYSLSLSNDTLVVGAPATNLPEMRAGAVFLYARQSNGWVETAQLSADNLRSGARFGWSVAASGDFIAVGARESGGTADVEESGEVYAFGIRGGQIVPLGQFAASSPAAFDHFSHAVAVTPDFILVGAPGTDSAPGTAYVVSLK